MARVNRRLQRQIRRTLYSLKRDYGVSIGIYLLGARNTNVRTGQVTVAKTVFHVKRAIALPEQLKRDRPRGIPETFNIRVGGEHDAGERSFLIDRRDVPNLEELTTDDWLAYSGDRYQIKIVENYETNAGWLITAKRTAGETPEEIVDVKLDDIVSFEQTTSAEQ